MTELSEYNGHPLIKIKLGEWQKDGETKVDWLTFGKKKAQAILDNLDDIKKFVGITEKEPEAKNEESEEEDLPF